MDNKRESAKKFGVTSLLFASGVALDCLSHATTNLPHDATLLGLSPHVVGGILTLGSHVVAHGVFEGWQKTKEHFAGDINSHLELAVKNAYHKTFAEIRKEIISEYDLKETKKELIFRYFLNKENQNSIAIDELNSEFLFPLEAALSNNSNIEAMLLNNEQLHPDSYLLKIIESVTPSYYHSDNKALNSFTSSVLEKFKRNYRHFFLKELKAEEKAKTVYFSHLLESILTKVDKIYKTTEEINNGMKTLIDFANEAKISFHSILGQLHDKIDLILENQNKFNSYFDLIIKQSNERRIITRIYKAQENINYEIFEEIVVRETFSLKQLENFLKIGNFKSADEETYNLFATSLDDANTLFDQNFILHFPNALFIEIDNLWMQNSNNKFGFTAQNEIWESFNRKESFFNKWQKFSEKVGWSQNLNWITNHDSFDFTFNAFKGHLPTLTVKKYGNTSKWKPAWKDNFESLTKKIKQCLSSY